MLSQLPVSAKEAGKTLLVCLFLNLCFNLLSLLAHNFHFPNIPSALLALTGKGCWKTVRGSGLQPLLVSRPPTKEGQLGILCRGYSLKDVSFVLLWQLLSV